MTDIIPFDFEGNRVRTVIIDGEPWFVAKDVTDLLGFKNGPDAIRKHVLPGQTNIAIRDVARDLGFQPGRAPLLINEAGVYRLIMRSNVPAAVRMQAWLTDEVLPTIRKSGGAYIMPGSKAEANLLNPDTMLDKFGELLELARGERAKRLEIETRNVKLAAKIEEDAPYVAASREFFDDDGLIRFRDSARALSMPERRFIALLREWGWVDVVGTAAKAYAIKQGYAKNLVYAYRGGHSVYGKLTRKGLERATVKAFGV
ncbi:BRO family protein [Nocardia terpenica]|uniref:Bro-N domain-containing protein n=1 Tax=Nocardia terpenica TaxID=455432 RepID=A0A291RTB7_9NOCA|nr:BRO family protein [Nocardia terpenica]ATL70753.1 hypothetical protein CRH09_35810 [Nocardia terpenica]